MGTFLVDGKGKGNKAEVSAHNQLEVNASNRSMMAYISKESQKAYSIYGRRNFAAASTDEGILYFEYTGDDNFYIDSVIVTGNGSNSKIELFTDSVYVSGGTVVTPINMNRASGLVLSATAYTGATDLSVTKGSNEIVDVRFGIDSATIKFDTSLILGRGNNIYILGEVSTIGDKIRAMILGYEDH